MIRILDVIFAAAILAIVCVAVVTFRIAYLRQVEIEDVPPRRCRKHYFGIGAGEGPCAICGTVVTFESRGH